MHAYIIDTGIWTLHPDFGGRADNVYDAFGLTGEDCHGHGTHVSGTIGGATYGVAKSVSLHGVRVLSCAGLGLTSQIIAGIDWVRQNAVKPAVANMSLGGGFYTSPSQVDGVVYADEIQKLQCAGLICGADLRAQEPTMAFRDHPGRGDQAGHCNAMASKISAQLRRSARNFPGSCCSEIIMRVMRPAPSIPRHSSRLQF